jgi:hypothetical protein
VSIRARLAKLLDSIDYLVYGLLFVLGFGALGYVAFVSCSG